MSREALARKIFFFFFLIFSFGVGGICLNNRCLSSWVWEHVIFITQRARSSFSILIWTQREVSYILRIPEHIFYLYNSGFCPPITSICKNSTHDAGQQNFATMFMNINTPLVFTYYKSCLWCENRQLHLTLTIWSSRWIGFSHSEKHTSHNSPTQFLKSLMLDSKCSTINLEFCYANSNTLLTICKILKSFIILI